MLRHLEVELDENGIAEWIDGRRRLRARRCELVAIEVRRGIVGLRAYAQILVGVTLVVGALVLAFAFAGFCDFGFGGGAAPLTGACVPVVMFGMYVMWFATRPALYLSLRSSDRVRNVVFAHGESDLGSLGEILARASRHWGYRVIWNVAAGPRPRELPYR